VKYCVEIVIGEWIEKRGIGVQVVKVEKLYVCPVCHRKFTSPATLISHAMKRHKIAILTEFQAKLYEVCKKLAENKGTFSTSDVVRAYRRRYGRYKLQDLRRSLIALSNKDLLECVEVRGGEFVWRLKK